LKTKDEARAATRSPSTFPSAVINSSVIPSEKYSLSGSALRFWNGSTASDGETYPRGTRRRGDAVGGWLGHLALVGTGGERRTDEAEKD
jgi:hypothetical protein